MVASSARSEPVDSDPADNSPAETVLAQDQCIGDGWLDVERWTRTVFLPLVMLTGGGAIVINTAVEFAEHLVELQQTASLRGMVTFATRIVTEELSARDMATVTSHRDHLDAMGQVVTSSSITWSLIRTKRGWRINQIHFNDARNDASVVSDMLRGKGAPE